MRYGEKKQSQINAASIMRGINCWSCSGIFRYGIGKTEAFGSIYLKSRTKIHYGLL